ncbi:MAG TPA: hypothetical protein VNA67_06020 [Pseudonocardiaceae bacterium]|nr:hypothetical protein [Pseudonocardiaceae bacterium]
MVTYSAGRHGRWARYGSTACPPHDEQHHLVVGEPREVFMHDLVLALSLHEVHARHLLSRANRRIAALNASVIFPRGAVHAIGNLNWRCTQPSRPAANYSSGRRHCSTSGRCTSDRCETLRRDLTELPRLITLAYLAREIELPMTGRGIRPAYRNGVNQLGTRWSDTNPGGGTAHLRQSDWSARLHHVAS